MRDFLAFEPYRAEGDGGGGAADNATIQHMRDTIAKQGDDLKALREQAAAADAARADAESKHKALMDAKLSDDERTKKQLTEASEKVALLGPEVAALKKSKEASDKALEGLYDQAIAAAPEAAREQVKELSSSGDWADRLRNANAALKLMGQPAGKVGPGASTQATVPPVKDEKGNEVKQPATKEQVASMNQQSWGSTFKKPLPGTTQT